jgi:hypothetical protein
MVFRLRSVAGIMLAAPVFVAAQCRESPTVLMNERTAETHLLADVKKVTLLVTVDRKGTICDARPVAGLQELRSQAVRAVKRHWRYRPFLIDWKPVVTRFPVTVRVVSRKPEPALTALAGRIPRDQTPLTP